MDKLTRYIAFLRGINVGGHRPLNMNDLRKMFTEIGFRNVSTYIQSGNVIFDAPDRADQLANKIQKQIKNSFGYEIPVIIYSFQDLKQIFKKYPFEKKEGWKRYITFIPSQPSEEQKENLESLSSKIESFHVGRQAVYVQVDKQTDEKPLFSNTFIQKKLNMPATNRNLRTVNKIIELALPSE